MRAGPRKKSVDRLGAVSQLVPRFASLQWQGRAPGSDPDAPGFCFPRAARVDHGNVCVMLPEDVESSKPHWGGHAKLYGPTACILQLRCVLLLPKRASFFP